MPRCASLCSASPCTGCGTESGEGRTLADADGRFRGRIRPLRTGFTDLIGCELPLQLAVLGGVGTAKLAEAVAGAGGLGMAPMGVDLPDQSPGVLGLGFLVPYLPALETITERACGVRVVEFFWGEPDARTVSAGHAAGALVSWQVGSAVEAAAAQRAGCDIVVIQGVEAGGHVRGAKPLDVLLRDTVEAVTIPTVAAGGVGTPERVRALLDAGADAVRVGTRFLAASEANVHPDYLAALIASSAADTVLTGHFETMGGGRGLCASSEHRSKGLRPPAIAAPCPPRCGLDTPGTMPWYAGLSVDHVHKIQAAADIVADLTSLLR